MRVQIRAVGRLKPGPENELINIYRSRFDATGRSLGLGPCTFNEIDDRKTKSKSDEAPLLLDGVPAGAVSVALDERGSTLTSPDFARKLAMWRDEGRPEVTFLIGGADGLHSSIREECDFSLALGKMVWPHMLVRTMLCEQLFRAASILAKKPYHRE